jgi:hydrogenase maturation protein HypF
VLALGGELKSSFCLQKGPFAFMSQYLGDLGSVEALKIYKENLDHMKSLLKIEPKAIACDLHPDYATTRLAYESGLPVIGVQHHHAHIASVMAEKGLKAVLGVAFDGTGYGTDGTVWGGEVLICRGAEFSRAAFLKPVAMLSGDESMKDCQKAADAWLYACGLPNVTNDERFPVIKKALDSGVNTIISSSMGRLFDAISSILGFANRNRYEGEGAILLENAAYRALKRNVSASTAFDIIEKDEALIMDPEPLIKEMAGALKKGSDKLLEELALGFHLAVCDCLVRVLEKLRARTGIGDAVLSGGVFQNRILTEASVKELERRGFKVYLPSLVPPNDGGISLGQAFIAMDKLEKMG